MEREKLDILRNDPIGSKALATAMDYACTFMGANKIPEVQLAVIADMNKNFGGCARSYLKEIHRDQNTPLYSLGKKEIGFI